MRQLVALTCLVLASLVGNVAAQHTLMTRVQMPAPAAMGYLQSSLEGHGYTVAHEQKCDGGMEMFGFETDYYRVAFFGKLAEVRELSRSHPGLTAYLPLKIAVVAEADETLLIALDPAALAGYFSGAALAPRFARWRNDILSVMADVRRAADSR